MGEYYARGIYLSLQSILDHTVNLEDKPILDISNQAENLNINVGKELAELLSKVLNHPNLPGQLSIDIANAISDNGESESLNNFKESQRVICEYLFGNEDV